jgi:hypothetical protein
MSAITVNNIHKTIIQALDADMDNSMASGVLAPDSSSLLDPMQGYAEAASVGYPPENLQPAVRAPFKNVSASLLKAISDVAVIYTVSVFQNGWVNFGSPWGNASYQIDCNGRVFLSGLIKNGAVDTTAFTLPNGFRPLQTVLASTISVNALGRVNIFTDGTVVPASPSTNGWVSLDGISFVSQGASFVP